MIEDSYRFSCAKWQYMDFDEHVAEIEVEISGLDPRDVARFMRDTSDLRAEALDRYRDIGPDEGDCWPLMLMAEAVVALERGDTDHAAYAVKLAARVRTMLSCRQIRDISEACGPAC